MKAKSADGLAIVVADLHDRTRRLFGQNSSTQSTHLTQMLLSACPTPSSSECDRMSEPRKSSTLWDGNSDEKDNRHEQENPQSQHSTQTMLSACTTPSTSECDNRLEPSQSNSDGNSSGLCDENDNQPPNKRRRCNEDTSVEDETLKRPGKGLRNRYSTFADVLKEPLKLPDLKAGDLHPGDILEEFMDAEYLLTVW